MRQRAPVMALTAVLTLAASAASAQTLSFEEQRAADGSAARFVSRGKGYTLALTEDGAMLAVGHGDAAAVLGLHFKGAVPRQPVGVDARAGRTYVVSGTEHTLTPLPAFRRVKFANVYPGIDAIYRGD